MVQAAWWPSKVGDAEHGCTFNQPREESSYRFVMLSFGQQVNRGPPGSEMCRKQGKIPQHPSADPQILVASARPKVFIAWPCTKLY
jgi:hypothetical protein